MSVPSRFAGVSSNDGDDDLRGPWSIFRDTVWPDLRRDTLALADLLDEFNPRFEVLCELLNWARDNRPGSRVIVRTQTRYAASALLGELSDTRSDLDRELGDGDPATALITVVPYSLPAPVGGHQASSCTPRCPRRGCAAHSCPAKSNEHIVAADADEKHWLNTLIEWPIKSGHL